MSEHDVDAILQTWADLYKLPPAHIEYLRKEVEDIVESGHEDRIKTDLDAIEQSASKSVIKRLNN